MESFWRRLRYYGIGFGLGLILTFGIFNTRGCSWMPENRVKEAMNKRIWLIDSQWKDSFYKAHKLNDRKFYKLLQNADISFSKSIRRGRHKVYDLTFKDGNNKQAHCLVSMTDESFVAEFITRIKNIKEFKKYKNYQKEFGMYAQLVHVPKNSNLVYVEKNSRAEALLNSQGILNNKQLQDRLLRGLFSYTESKLNAEPRPIHVFRFSTKQNAKTVMYATCIWYKDKIKVSNLEIEPLNF